MRNWINGGVAAGVLALLLVLIIPAIQQARTAARRSQARNNLKQIALAFQIFHDVNDVFPPGGTVDESGKGLHGWYPQLMPYLACSPFYNEINFEQAWDDPVNAPIFKEQYWGAHNPLVPPGHCYTQEGFVLLHYMGNPAVLHRNSSVSMSDFEGGSAHTWLIGEVAGDFQPWGYPFNWRSWDAAPGTTANGYGLPDEQGANFCIGDGSVRFISSKIETPSDAGLAGGPPWPGDAAVSTPTRKFEPSPKPCE